MSDHATPAVEGLDDVRGMDLAQRFVRTWMSDNHERHRFCPVCTEDLSRVGIDRLVYTFERCSCGVPAHMVEQIWHRKCLVGWTQASAV